MIERFWELPCGVQLLGLLLALPVMTLVVAWTVYLTMPVWLAIGRGICAIWPPGWTC